MSTCAAEIARRKATHESYMARCRSRAESEAAAVALWPTMSIRDIAKELDTSIPFVQHAAAKAGLPSRVISRTP